jgi:putative PEP-CTERM system TPR-repeat lipoprotein
MFGLLSGCDEPSEVKSGDFLERAQQHREKGELRASIIELKNAIQQNPKNATVRLLLGRNYLDLGEVAAAEIQLIRARDLGAESAELITALAKAWFLLGKHQEVLDQLHVGDWMGASEKAAISAAHGNAQRGLGMLAEAEQSFGEALSQDPLNLTAIIGLARLAVQQGDQTGAVENLNLAIETAPGNPEVLALQGDLMFVMERTEEAERAFQELVDVMPGSFTPRLSLAVTKISAGKLDDAAQYLDQLLETAPRHPFANYLRALAAYLAQDYETANFHVEIAASSNFDHPPSRLLAGATKFALNEHEQALRYLTEFTGKVPSHDAARQLLGATLMRLGRLGEARRVLQPLADKGTSDTKILAMIGAAAAQSGDPESAREYIDRAAAEQPESTATQAQLGILRVAIGDLEQGVEDLETVIKKDPSLDQAYLAMIVAYLRSEKFDEALEAAAQLRDSHPNSPMGSTLMGIAHFGKGELELARAAFLDALQIAPGSPDISGNLATVEMRSGNADRALSLLNDTLEKNPEHVPTMVRLGQLYAQLGQTEAAKTQFQRLLEIKPDNVEARIFVARIHFNEGEPKRALDLTEAYVPDYPSDPDLLEVVGQARLALGRAADAAVSFRALAELQPKSAQAHWLLAAAYQDLGDQARFRKELETTLGIDPEHIEAKLSLASLLGQLGELEATRQLLAELKQEAPSRREVIELDGSMAFYENRLDEAVQLLTEAARQGATSDLTMKLAMAQQRSGNLEDSQTTLEDWLQMHPGDLDARFLLANQYVVTDQIDLARVHYLVLVEAAPRNVAVLNNFAWLLLRAGEAEAALTYAERAFELARDDGEVLDTLGLVMRELGQRKKALNLFQAAVAAAPASPEIKLHLAQTLAEEGRESEAQAILRQLLAENAQFPGRGDAQSLLESLDD